MPEGSVERQIKDHRLANYGLLAASDLSSIQFVFVYRNVQIWCPHIWLPVTHQNTSGIKGRRKVESKDSPPRGVVGVIVMCFFPVSFICNIAFSNHTS